MAQGSRGSPCSVLGQRSWSSVLQACIFLRGKEHGSRNSAFVLKERREDTGPPGLAPVRQGLCLPTHPGNVPSKQYPGQPVPSPTSHPWWESWGRRLGAIVPRDNSPGSGLGRARVLSSPALGGGTRYPREVASPAFALGWAGSHSGHHFGGERAWSRQRCFLFPLGRVYRGQNEEGSRHFARDHGRVGMAPQNGRNPQSVLRCSLDFRLHGGRDFVLFLAASSVPQILPGTEQGSENIRDSRNPSAFPFTTPRTRLKAADALSALPSQTSLVSIVVYITF